MKLNYLKKKNQYYFSIFLKFSHLSLLFKFFFFSYKLFFKFRQYIAFFFKKLRPSSFFLRNKLRCILSNYNKVYNYKFYLSRKELRRCFLSGRLEGFVKSS